MIPYRSEKEFLKALKRFNTLSAQKYGWYTGTSDKEHTCEFGHTIPPNDLYFKKPLDLDGEQKIRVCKPCMEKLVFMAVDSDTHAREITDGLFRRYNPPQKKIARIQPR